MLLDLAEVLRAADRDADAGRAVVQAAVLYEQKGHVVGLAQTRALLAANPVS